MLAAHRYPRPQHVVAECLNLAVQVGVGEGDATTTLDVHGLVTVIPMEHTRLGKLGFIEHSDIQLCIGDRPLQVLLLLHFIHTSDIPYSNRHLSPPPSVPSLDRLVGSCIRIILVFVLS